MTRIGVNGALGRMGTRILLLAHEDAAHFKIAGAFDLPGTNRIGKDVGELLGVGNLSVPVATLAQGGPGGLSGCDALIDFTGPEGAMQALSQAVAHKKALVIGSTGLSEEQEKSIRSASAAIAVVYASNMSVGVNLLLELVEAAARKLSLDFDIEISEAHHRHKKDAPSGTALSLAKAVAKGRGWDVKKVLRFRTEGKVSADRPREEIGMQVVRAGEIVGDHTVLFGGPAETIEITHRAHSRDTFARGALLAAAFAAAKQAQGKPGLYTMADVLSGGSL